MVKVFAVCLFFILGLGNLLHAATVISNQGWTITADSEQGVLTVEHTSLGTVLQKVRLGIEGRPTLTRWSAEATGRSLLTVRTADPAGVWLFEIHQEYITVSSTFSKGVLEGQAPSSLSRIPVRTLDAEGYPVDWRGTDELIFSFGGA